MSAPNFRSDQSLIEPLTSRELEILSQFSENRSNREIADLLVLSLNTVKWYARQIYGKLGVSDRRQAVVRARDLGLLAAGVPAPLPAHNLPAQLTPFLGRRQMLAEINERMSEPAVRLLTVIGPGGMGKTRLAIAGASLLLEEHRDSLPDGVFFVPLDPVSNSALIASAIAQSIGFHFYKEGNERPIQQLVHYLVNKRMLLVLDNIEHLIGQESIRLLAEILESAPGIKMLVTSRARLNMQGEHLFPLGGMQVPERRVISRWQSPVEQAQTFSGIQLFLHSARRLRPDFELESDNLLPITHICESVVGMPLGIELAAGWVAILEPQEIAAEIDQNLDFLVTEAGNVPERQQSLRAVFDTSWRLLTEQEQQAVPRLAVFQDGFDRDGAKHAAQVSLGTLLALVNKSWLQQGAGGRFQVHDLLRRYGQKKLERDPAEETAARDQHSRYYCDWLRHQEDGTWGAQQQTVLAAIDGDIGNVHTACKWAASKGHVHRLGRAVNALGMFYFQWRGSYQAGEGIFGELAETLAAVEGRAAPAVATVQRTMARLLGWRSTFCALVGDLPRGTRLLGEGLALLDGPTLVAEDTRFERAHLLWQSGYLVLYTDPATARQRFAESLELYREIGYKWGEASALLGLGRAARGVDALDDARHALASSLALHREVGNSHGEIESLATLGGLAIRQARFEEAEHLIQESLAITPETDHFGIAFGLGFLGSAQLHTGQFEKAEMSLQACIALHKDLGMRGYRLHWRTYLGLVYLHTGRYRAARTQAELILSRARQLEYDRGISMGLALLGEVALVEGEFDQALRHLEESPDAFCPDAIGMREPAQLAMLGLAARGLDRRARAQQHLFSSLDQASQAQQFMELMVALAGIALLLADEGEVEQAVELYALASRYPFVANSRWFEDVVGRHITATAAVLPRERVRAARDRARAHDLEATVAELLEERTA